MTQIMTQRIVTVKQVSSVEILKKIIKKRENKEAWTKKEEAECDDKGWRKRA